MIIGLMSVILDCFWCLGFKAKYSEATDGEVFGGLDLGYIIGVS